MKDVDDNQQACLGFSLCNGIGPITFLKLVAHFGSPHSAFIAPSSELRTFFRQTKNFEGFILFRNSYNPTQEIKRIQKDTTWIMTQWDDDYPKLLKTIIDPPISLFGKGDRNSIDFSNDTCVGIVGARKNTPYGKYVAEELGRAFSGAGLVIVSGLASGIDTISHNAAIEKGARTIAILGTGIDIIYPRENKELYEKIVKEYGVILSEYAPGTPTNPGMFVLRNRIVVGISKAIVVVEGGIHSGTLTTARYAAENGRDVYAVPGPITSDMSVGPHILLREGAHVLSNANELLKDFGLIQQSNRIIRNTIDLSGEEKIIYDLLSVKKYNTDEVARKISLTISETLPILSLLEVRGVIGKDLDGSFTVKV